MTPQFARNPTDAMQCYAEFLDHASFDRTDPLHVTIAHEMPVYFISGRMGKTLAAISRTFPLDAKRSDEWGCGFLVFERPTLFVTQHGTRLSPSGLHWAPNGVTPIWWEPPHFYRFDDSHRSEGEKWIGALAALLRQKLATITKTPVGKHVAKRLKLSGSPPTCRVVTLREREYRSTSESTDVIWSCRWLVRGHWRVLETGPTWVTAHVKGPRDKPMKAPAARIFGVVR